MNKDKIVKALDDLRKNSQKRNFNQSVELIINLKDIDIKKTDQTFELFLILPHDMGRSIKTCCLIGPELKEQSKACDKSILQEEFRNYQGDKKGIRKLANQYDYFIAQANIMNDIAKVFGSILGPKRKMPNPKAGCVVPPNTNLTELVKKLKKTVRLGDKTEPVIKCIIGKQDYDNDKLVENILAAYNNTINHLANGINNIRSVLLKLSMSKPVKVES